MYFCLQVSPVFCLATFLGEVRHRARCNSYSTWLPPLTSSESRPKPRWGAALWTSCFGAKGIQRRSRGFPLLCIEFRTSPHAVPSPKRTILGQQMLSKRSKQKLQGRALQKAGKKECDERAQTEGPEEKEKKCQWGSELTGETTETLTPCIAFSKQKCPI